MDSMIICEVQVWAIIRGGGCELQHADADIFFSEVSKTLKNLVTWKVTGLY
jgi:tartrate dehydratase alpha subunit/fumarate hydratase class I-like protein